MTTVHFTIDMVCPLSVKLTLYFQNQLLRKRRLLKITGKHIWISYIQVNLSAQSNVIAHHSTDSVKHRINQSNFATYIH